MKFSVIVPVYNHWHLVPKLIARLEAQTYPLDDFELFLIDNGSEHFHPPDELPRNTRVLQCNQPGSYAARNHGIERAAGDWLVFTDADCLPRPDWIEKLMSRAGQADNHTILAGAVEMIPQNDPPNRWEIYDLVRGIPQAWYVRRGYAATANLAVPANLMRRLDGFDATRLSGGDADLCRRARAAGARLEYVPEAVVEHPARTTRAELVAKVRRIKAGQVVARDWPRRLRTFLPPVIEMWKCLCARRWPIRYRLIAIFVQLTLWPVEMRQALNPEQVR